jgi:hypothetical protein
VFSEAGDVLAQYRGDEGGQERARVYGEVEEREEGGQVGLLLGQLELIAAEGRHAGLNAACAKGYEEEAQEGQFPKGEKRSLRFSLDMPCAFNCPSRCGLFFFFFSSLIADFS